MPENEVPAFDVSVFGDVSDGFVSEVKATLCTAYAAFEGEVPATVRVRIVDGLLNLKELCEAEREETGRDSFGEEGYLTRHEVVDGSSRITICWQRADELPPVLGRAALQHEAAHSVLHGTERMAEFEISPEMLRGAKSNRVRLPVLRTIVWLVSQAVKDFEVARLLCASGLRAPQTALAVHSFAEIAKERPPWRRVSGTAEGRFVYLADHLRALLYTEPLQAPESNLSEVSNAISHALSDLPDDTREELISLSASLAESLSDDTHANVHQAVLALLTASPGTS